MAAGSGMHAAHAAHNRCGRVAPSTSANAGAWSSTRGVVHASQNTSPHPRQWCFLTSEENTREQARHSYARVYGVQLPWTDSRIVRRPLRGLVAAPLGVLGAVPCIRTHSNIQANVVLVSLPVVLCKQRARFNSVKNCQCLNNPEDALPLALALALAVHRHGGEYHDVG